MNKKHKELLGRFEKRSKELSDFLSGAGDNITSEQYTEATAIRDDLKTIRGEIEDCKKYEGLTKEAAEFRSYVEDPVTGHRHSNGTQVLGTTPAGETELEVEYEDVKGRRSPAWKARARVKRILNEGGSGVLGQSGGQGYARNAAQVIQTREYRQALRAYFAGKMTSAHKRNLEDGLDPQGGYLAPVENIAKLIEKKPTPTRVSDLCSVINSSRDSIALPRVNYTTATDDALGNIYTTGFRATLTDENPTSATQANVNDTNIFGSVRVSIFTWMIEGVLTNNMVEDAMFDPLVWMSGKFDETIRLLKDNMALNGTGAAQPIGILANPGGTDTLSYPPVINSLAATTPFLTPDGLINLSEDIPEQYDENIRYLYKKTSTGKTIRTFKDGNGRYIFGTGTQDSGLMPGRVKEINGYPSIYSQFMPDPAALAYPVIAGDFEGVYMVNRIGYSVQVLREIAARQNQLVVLGRVRFGVQVLEPWRLRVQYCHS